MATRKGKGYQCEIWATSACTLHDWRRVEELELEQDEDGKPYVRRRIPLLANVYLEGRTVTISFGKKVRFHDEHIIQLRPLADP